VRGKLEGVGAFVAYLAISLLVLGRVLGDLRGSVVGSYGGDQSFFAWSLAWWPDAVRDLRDPLLTDRIYAPHGFNLAWATVIPGPAFVAAPLTLLAGAIVSYNILALLALPLNGLAAFLLCREVTGRALPALLGGGVFAFSSYGLAESVNHLNLALVFCVPLAALVAVRHARGALTDRGAALRIGALVVVQLTIFTEVLATAALFGLATLALFRLWRTGVVAIAGLAIGALIASPYLYVAFAHPNPLQQGTGPLRYPTDLANLWTPTRVTALGSDRNAAVAARMVGGLTEQTAYFGAGLLTLVVVFAVVFGGTRFGWRLPAVFVGVLVCALGSHITLRGDERWRGPWLLISKLPLLHLALPSRFPVYAWLAVAVMCALLVARARRPAIAWPLVLLALVPILPSRAASLWKTPVPLPALFADDRERSVIRTDSAVMVLPWSFLGPGMRWQMESEFRFRLVGGYAASLVPDFYWRYPVVRSFYGLPRPANAPAELDRFLRETGTETVLVSPGAANGWDEVLRTAGWQEREIGGVLVYRRT
jgi:hypothetical protein